jgi:hypothetical protein
MTQQEQIRKDKSNSLPFPDRKKRKTRKNIILPVVVFLCLSALTMYSNTPAAGERMQQTNVDPRLWGVWELDSIELKTSGISQKYQVETILQNPIVQNLLGSTIDNRYFTVLFYQNSVEVGINGAVNGNVKGTCSSSNGILTVALYNETPQTFDYLPTGEKLYLSYTRQERQLSLIFKLNTKF